MLMHSGNIDSRHRMLGTESHRLNNMLENTDEMIYVEGKDFAPARQQLASTLYIP
jgi:hypothetical protein